MRNTKALSSSLRTWDWVFHWCQMKWYLSRRREMSVRKFRLTTRFMILRFLVRLTTLRSSWPGTQLILEDKHECKLTRRLTRKKRKEKSKIWTKTMNLLTTRIWSLAVMMSQSTEMRLTMRTAEILRILKQWGKSCSQESERSLNATRTSKAQMMTSLTFSSASASGKILVKNCWIQKKKRKRKKNKVNLKSGRKRELIKKERKSTVSKKEWRKRKSKARWRRSKSNNRSLSEHSCNYSSETPKIKSQSLQKKNVLWTADSKQAATEITLLTRLTGNSRRWFWATTRWSNGQRNTETVLINNFSIIV